MDQVQATQPMFQNFASPLRIVALAVALAVAATEGSSGPHVSILTCTNPASGATWQVGIDFHRSTVDENPADVTASAVAWHDAKDGMNYTLDRKSGELTAVAASSTGGYFLHDHCKAAKSR